MLLSDVDEQFNEDLDQIYRKGERAARARSTEKAFDFGDGDVVIAAITSCTNTSNPSVLIAAGLVARKARAQGPRTSKPWVKTSLAPGSAGGHRLSERGGLSEDLNALGFDLVGYGCTTCIGNSGPAGRADQQGDQRAMTWSPSASSRATAISKDACRPTAAPTSSPRRRWSSPIALKGTVRTDMIDEPIGTATNGEAVYLKDIWPTTRKFAS